MFRFTTPSLKPWTILGIFVAVLLFSFSCQAAPIPTTFQSASALLVPAPTVMTSLTPTETGTSPTPSPTYDLNLDLQTAQARYKKIMTDYLASHTPSDLANLDADLKKLSGNDDIPWTVLVEPVGANGQNIVIVRDNVARWDSSWTLYYWLANKWHAQELAYGFSLGLTAARQILYQGQVELLIAYDNSPDSNAPEAGFDLWRRDGETWQRIWQLPATDPRKVDATTELADSSLNTIQLKYDSWLLDEEKSQLFGESHAGPHRYFDETWVRAGEGYCLAETRVQPSAYNTLIEFEYALQHQRFTTARQWATEAGLVDTARQFQLEQLPIKREMIIGPADSATADWTQTGPIVLEWQNRLITFSFTQQGSQWLLSAIETSPSATPTPGR